jgi:hypothetical protein
MSLTLLRSPTIPLSKSPKLKQLGEPRAVVEPTGPAKESAGTSTSKRLSTGGVTTWTPCASISFGIVVKITTGFVNVPASTSMEAVSGIKAGMGRERGGADPVAQLRSEATKQALYTGFMLEELGI